MATTAGSRLIRRSSHGREELVHVELLDDELVPNGRGSPRRGAAVLPASGSWLIRPSARGLEELVPQVV
eukprot:8248149-Heterocapsa_arctica.AAC.1